MKKKQRADAKGSVDIVDEQVTDIQQLDDGQAMDGQRTDIGQSNVSIGKVR